ncbi:UNVERIFIED_CONTAM: hypothetical protein GTU68_002509 [Idotea baltica]|nr:hypothetical protein [Idotea baltica]
MRWRSRRRSDNVVDRRGMRMRGAKPALGITGILVIGAVALLFGADPLEVISLMSKQAPVNTRVENSAQQGAKPKNDTAKAFVSTILASTEDTWREILKEKGANYQEPKLVLFTGEVSSACGYTSAAVGPFYCPGDYQVYLDLSFFNELAKMGAVGDFAAGYVIAHEVGHHVQNILGVISQVQKAKSKLSKVEANALQVRVELQADCFAGVWGYFANIKHKMLEGGDLEEGLAAATAVGDDTMQKRAGQRVQPDGFTHGSAAERVHWFKRGFSSGDLDACNTFS